MKKLLFFASALFLSSTLFYSCEKEITQIPAETSTNFINTIEVVDGTLRFTDEEHLQTTFKYVTDEYKKHTTSLREKAISMTAKELELAPDESFNTNESFEVFEKTVGFYSLREKLDTEDAAFLEIEGNTPDYLPSDAYILKSSSILVFLNPNGEIMVGDKKVNVLDEVTKDVTPKSYTCIRNSHNTFPVNTTTDRVRHDFGVIGVHWPFNTTQSFSKIRTYKKKASRSRWRRTKFYLGADWSKKLTNSDCTTIPVNRTANFSLMVSHQSSYGSSYEYHDNYYFRRFSAVDNDTRFHIYWASNQNFTPYGFHTDTF